MSRVQIRLNIGWKDRSEPRWHGGIGVMVTTSAGLLSCSDDPCSQFCSGQTIYAMRFWTDFQFPLSPFSRPRLLLRQFSRLRSGSARLIIVVTCFLMVFFIESHLFNDNYTHGIQSSNFTVYFKCFFTISWCIYNSDIQESNIYEDVIYYKKNDNFDSL